MEGGVVLILALGVFIFTLILLSIRFQMGNQKHEAVQLLFFGLVIVSLMLVSKAAYDYKDNCDWVVANETVSGNTTSFSNEYLCSENTNETTTTFLDTTLWLFRLIIAYIIVYIFYNLFKNIRDRMEGRNE